MKQILLPLAISFSLFVNAQNVGVGTPTPVHKLDVQGNIGMFGRLALSDISDGYLWMNASGNYVSGIISPGAFRADGGISSNAISSGIGTINVSGQIRGAIFYDADNSSYYLNPATTSN